MMIEEPTTKNNLEVDCISRQALLNATVKKSSIWNHITNSEGDNLEAIVSKLPPITPQPRKGHWMGKGDFTTCSCCNEMSYPFEPTGYGSFYHNYCPNCGADMRGEEE